MITKSSGPSPTNHSTIMIHVNATINNKNGEIGSGSFEIMISIVEIMMINGEYLNSNVMT